MPQEHIVCFVHHYIMSSRTLLFHYCLPEWEQWLDHSWSSVKNSWRSDFLVPILPDSCCLLVAVCWAVWCCFSNRLAMCAMCTVRQSEGFSNMFAMNVLNHSSCLSYQLTFWKVSWLQRGRPCGTRRWGRVLTRGTKGAVRWKWEFWKADSAASMFGWVLCRKQKNSKLFLSTSFLFVLFSFSTD